MSGCYDHSDYGYDYNNCWDYNDCYRPRRRHHRPRYNDCYDYSYCS